MLDSFEKTQPYGFTFRSSCCLLLAAVFLAIMPPAFSADKVSPLKSKATVQTRNLSRLSTVYVLKQTSRQGGAETLFVSDDAVRIVQENAGRWTLASSPGWSPIVLNTVNHTYCEAKGDSRNLLMQRYMMIEGGDLTKCKWKPVEKAKIGSLAAERVIDANSASADREAAFDSMADELKICGFWVASDLKISPGAANLVARIRGCPQIGRFPLRFIHITRAGRKSVIIDTFSCEKKSMPLAEMRIPAGYRRTRTEYDGGLSDSNMLEELVPQTRGKTGGQGGK